jgi:lysyl-tRNA synthetase class 2
MLVGGVDKVFEIGRVFRNEGLSRKHNPEFTMLEAYQAFGDYESMMELVQGMVCHVAQKVLGTLKIERPQQKSQVAFVSNSVVQLIKDGTFESLSNSPRLENLKKLREQIWTIGESIQLENSDSYEIAGATIKVVEEIINVLRNELKGMDSTSAAGTAWLIGELKKNHRMFIPLSQKIINLTPPWKIAKYKDLIREAAKSDWFEIKPPERRTFANFLGAEIGKEYEDFEVTQAVFEKLIEPTLIQPTFVTHAPKELIPLAKLSPDDPTTVEVFECCINGQEIAPAYTEQNDPIEQRERLEHQAGGEQQKLDEDFLVALEHGMPPAGGMGMGIDRLCMMLLGQESIRDVILFPQLKPK